MQFSEIVALDRAGPEGDATRSRSCRVVEGGGGPQQVTQRAPAVCLRGGAGVGVRPNEGEPSEAV